MSFPRYPAYKDSGVEWLGKVPAHWQVRRLKQACHVFPSNVDKKFHEGETAVVLCNYTDVYNNDVISADMNFMAATASSDQIAKFTLRAADTIVTKDSETADDIAIAAYVPADLPGVICGYHLSIVRPLPATDGAFVKRLFDSNYTKSCFAVRANGLTRVGLSQYELDNIELPFPPYAEQKQIASFLDWETLRIDSLVAEQRQLIKLLKEKRQVVISHAVTKGLNPNVSLKSSDIECLGDVPAHWKVEPLKYSTTKIEQGWSPQCDSEPAGEGEWGVLKVGCGNADEFDPNEQKALPADIAPMDNYEIKSGDILMSRGNTPELVGMATFVGEVRPRLLLSDLLYRFRARPQLAEGKFLALSLRSPSLRFQIERDATGTSPSMKKISQGDIRGLLIALPPIEEQRLILEFVEAETAKLDTLLAGAQQAIDFLQERRHALISAAVTGQIDIRSAAERKAA